MRANGGTGVRQSATQRPTMKDVAHSAGVSLKTVSRVINEEAGVAPPTAARVTEAIQKLGFERNDLARSLRPGQQSATLGLVIEDVANPFYSVITQAVENAARARGFLLITGSAREDPERERELVTALLRRRVDALLVVPAGTDHRYLAGGGWRLPAVFLDRPPGMIEADTVVMENAGGARRGVEHLLAQGHTRIACVTDAAELHTARERLAGYRAALAATGVAEDPALVRTGNRDAADAQASVRELLTLPEDRRPTAIFAGNNRTTGGVLRALAGHDRRLAVVGFDDFEYADLLGVTVVRSDPGLMGEQGAALAFARLDGDDRPPQHITVPTELVPRGSGEVAP